MGGQSRSPISDHQFIGKRISCLPSVCFKSGQFVLMYVNLPKNFLKLS